MKRGWLLVLLISLGLNVGLGTRIFFDSAADCAADFLGCGPGETGPDVMRGPGLGPDRRNGSRSFAMADSNRWNTLAKCRMDKLSGALNLSPEQADAFWENHRKISRTSWEQRKLIESARINLHEAVAASPVNSDDIRNAIHTLANYQAGTLRLCLGGTDG